MASDLGQHLPDGATLVDVSDLPAEEWDRLAVLSERGHAFQSHAWGALKAGAGWSVQRFRVDRDERALAVFAVQARRLGEMLGGRVGALRRFVPSRLAERTYVYAPRGPIMVDDSPKADLAALSGVREAARRLDAAIVTVDPLWTVDGPGAGALARTGFGPARGDVQISRTAMLIPLLPTDDEQHRRVRKSTANLINRARKAGVTLERIELDDPGTDDPEAALGEMHGLLEATARREDLILRDRDYQLAQWRALGRAGHATIWFAGVRGSRWVGSVTLRCGATLHQYQAGSADGVDLRDVPANHLLQWEIMRWAAGQGYRHYDLGGVDTPAARGIPQGDRDPLWNLYVFKRGFGAEGIEYLPAHEHTTNPLVRLAWGVARGARG